MNGDTVTLYLEVKSSRERATPDKAVWGYSVIVAADQVYTRVSLSILVQGSVVQRWVSANPGLKFNSLF